MTPFQYRGGRCNICRNDNWVPGLCLMLNVEVREIRTISSLYSVRIFRAIRFVHGRHLICAAHGFGKSQPTCLGWRCRLFYSPNLHRFRGSFALINATRQGSRNSFLTLGDFSHAHTVVGELGSGVTGLATIYVTGSHLVEQIPRPHLHFVLKLSNLVHWYFLLYYFI